jgi:hypothetical protein
MPVSVGRFLSSSVKASRPPADAPTPTMGNDSFAAGVDASVDVFTADRRRAADGATRVDCAALARVTHHCAGSEVERRRVVRVMSGGPDRWLTRRPCDFTTGGRCAFPALPLLWILVRNALEARMKLREFRHDASIADERSADRSPAFLTLYSIAANVRASLFEGEMLERSIRHAWKACAFRNTCICVLRGSDEPVAEIVQCDEAQKRGRQHRNPSSRWAPELQIMLVASPRKVPSSKLFSSSHFRVRVLRSSL